MSLFLLTPFGFLEDDGRVAPDSGSGIRLIVAKALEPGVAGDLIEAVIHKPVQLS